MRYARAPLAALLVLLLAVRWPTGPLPASAQAASATPAVGTPLPTAPGVEETLLATRFLDAAPPDRRWVLRRGHPLDEDAHAHAGGFVYEAMGRSVLVVEDTQGVILSEGTAAWAPEGIGHLHGSPSGTASSGRSSGPAERELWTILLERENDVRRPGAALMSPPLVGLLSGAYEARLVAATFQPGAAAGPRRRTGPELVCLLDGAWELEYDGVPFALAGGDGYLADPGVPHRLRNTGPQPARLLSAQLVPFGRPPDEPAPAAGR